MTKSVILTKMVVETFIKEGNLNERQIAIMKMRAKSIPISAQAEKLHLSIDQINKEIAHLKKIYDEVQKTSSVLPKRAKNKKELYEMIEKERQLQKIS